MTSSIEVPLTQGYIALIDADRAELVSKYAWYVLTGYHYAATRCPDSGKIIYMHRLLTNAPSGYHVDHINGDVRDNRSVNLRVCTHSNNLCNQPIRRNNTSGYKGVSFRKDTKKWQAKIRVACKQHHLGYFLTKEDAALVYNEAAIRLHGEFAVLNEITNAGT